MRVAAALYGELTLELAGDAAAVAGDQEALTRELGAAAAPADAIARVRAAQAAGSLRVRVAALPAGALPLARALAAAGATTLAYPARGLVYASFAMDAEDVVALGAALAAVRSAAEGARAAWRVEQAPLALRRGELAGGPGAPALERAVKRSFDPSGILNPGRGPGE